MTKLHGYALITTACLWLLVVIVWLQYDQIKELRTANAIVLETNTRWEAATNKCIALLER